MTKKIISILPFLFLLGCDTTVESNFEGTPSGQTEDFQETAPVTLDIDLPAFTAENLIDRIVLQVSGSDMTEIIRVIRPPFNVTTFQVNVPIGSSRTFKVSTPTNITNDSFSSYMGVQIIDVGIEPLIINMPLSFLNFAVDAASTDTPPDQLIHVDSHYPDITFAQTFLNTSERPTLANDCAVDEVVFFVKFHDDLGIPNPGDAIVTHIEFDVDDDLDTGSLVSYIEVQRDRGLITTLISGTNFVAEATVNGADPTRPAMRLINPDGTTVPEPLGSPASFDLATKRLTVCIPINTFTILDADQSGAFNIMASRKITALEPNDILYRSGVVKYNYFFNSQAVPTNGSN